MLDTLYVIQLFLSIFLIVFLAYNLSALTYRNLFNKRCDKRLNVNTRGLRSWGRKSLYNRTESTPYLALHDFLKEYKFSKTDHLVDFGCGKGRVAIFFNKKCLVPVTGIELNDLTYEELKNNVESSKAGSVVLRKEKAEEYKIADNENKFFFFNPFSSIIFKHVVKNIVEDARNKNKDIEIILYYPLQSYKEILEDDFEVLKEIKVRGSIGYREKFLIYKLKKV